MLCVGYMLVKGRCVGGGASVFILGLHKCRMCVGYVLVKSVFVGGAYIKGYT